MSTAAAVARKAAQVALASAQGAAKVASPAAPKGKLVLSTPHKDAAMAMGYSSREESITSIASLVAGIRKESALLMSLRASNFFSFEPTTGKMSPQLSGPLPDRPPTPLAGRVFNKRLRLHPHWKLRPARKWVDFVPFIKEFYIAYDPAVDGFVGARELGRQARSPKVAAKFPTCNVIVQEKDDGSPAIVTVQWVSEFADYHAPPILHSFFQSCLVSRDWSTHPPKSSPPTSSTSSEQWQIFFRTRSIF